MSLLIKCYCCVTQSNSREDLQEFEILGDKVEGSNKAGPLMVSKLSLAPYQILLDFLYLTLIDVILQINTLLSYL